VQTRLLATKLFPPALHPEAISRPRLMRKLDRSLYSRLTLLSAPAGFGKTTLLAQWISQAELSVAWLSLDAGDNDMGRFLHYLVAALRTVEANAGRIAVGIGPSLRLPEIHTTLTALINGLTAIQHHFVLALDDYHLIQERSIHEIMTFLVEHLPPRMHLVVATRADPPLPLARLRARGQLLEVRAADLRFTLEEAAQFLNQAAGLDLCATDVAALEARTEGWVAGLQLAALSLQGAKDPSRLVAAFSGSHQFVADYLTDEILTRQPEGLRLFLLQTSILERLCGPLCNAVTGQAGGQETLEALQRANLFLTPLDEERRWYRYHRLFADLLRQRLHERHPDSLPELHLRASAWYEGQGLMAEAIQHAFAAGDFRRSVCLIERAADAALMRGEVVTFRKWVERLPDDLVRARPSLCALHAWASMLAGRPLRTLEPLLLRAEPSTAAPIQALLALIRGDVDRAEQLAGAALAELPAEETFLRGLAAWACAMSRCVRDPGQADLQALHQFAEATQETGNVLVSAMALSDLAALWMRQGQLRRAKAVYQRAVDLATDREGHLLPAASEALRGLGLLALEWNDLKAADHYLRQSLELARWVGGVTALETHVGIARLRRARADLEGAHEALDAAEQLALQFDALEADDTLVAVQRAELWLAQGNLQAVAQWARDRKLTPESAPRSWNEPELALESHMRKYEYLLLARLLLAERRPAEAVALLDPMLSGVERHRVIIQIHLLKALAHQAQRDSQGALACLAEALRLGEPEGYIRVFVDEGPPLEQLLRQAAARGQFTSYVLRLLAAFGPQLPSVSGQPLIEPLSERELEVLRFLATSRSVPDIARELHVEVSTVRSHTKSIYAKLAAHSRLEAVERARELRLI